MAFPGQTLAELEAQLLTTSTQIRNLHALRKAIATEIQSRKAIAAADALLASMTEERRNALRLALKDYS